MPEREYKKKTETKLVNAIICFGYFIKKQPNKHAKPKHPKNTLHLFIYGLALLISYRNSLYCIIISISLLLLHFCRKAHLFSVTQGHRVRGKLFWQCLALSVIFFCCAYINLNV